MDTYISLIKFTEKGITQIKDSPKRARAFVEAAEAGGVKIVGQYWTVGRYDGVLVIEAEDKKKALRCLAELVSSGNVTTESLEAFDAAAFEGIVGTA